MFPYCISLIESGPSDRKNAMLYLLGNQTATGKNVVQLKKKRGLLLVIRENSARLFAFNDNGLVSFFSPEMDFNFRKIAL